MKIALIQTEPFFLDVQANLKKALDVLSNFQADVFVFPELFLSGYTFATKEEVKKASISSDARGPLKPFYDVSKECSLGICGGYSEHYNDTYYNSAFFIGDGKLLANYRKIHLFKDEKQFFEPGDEGFNVIDYKNARLGIMICFDWIFPESSRTLAIKGAQIILHPSNLVLPYCQRAAFARAIENRVFMVTVNRIGREINQHLENTFTGKSQVVSPYGDYLLEMSENHAEVQILDVEPSEADDKGITPYNHLFNDRRKEFYL